MVFITKMYKVLILLVSCIFVFGACESNSIDEDAYEASYEPNTESSYTITYGGTTYENVKVVFDEHGNFASFSGSFGEIYNSRLASNSSFSVYVNSARELSFYDNLDENLKDNELTVIPSSLYHQTRVSTRSSSVNNIPGYNYNSVLELYDDRNFEDRHYSFSLNDSIIEVENSDLKKSPYKFNDKCSSLRIANNLPTKEGYFLKLGAYSYETKDIVAVFIGFDDKNFSDRTIVCSTGAGTLKEYRSLPGFNDKLSSFKFLYAQKGQYTDHF